MRGVLIKFRYCVENRQARAGGTLRVVVVGLRIAEVRHYSVTKVLRDMTVESLYCLRRRTVVLADDLTPLLGIKMAGYLGRTDEIAEKHRQMAVFALWRFVLRAVFEPDCCG